LSPCSQRNALIWRFFFTGIPRNQLHIQSKVDGTVRRVNLTPGTKVKKGDLLLELTNDKLESALQEAELDLDTARTEIQQNQTLKEQEYLNAKSTLQEAELQLELRESEYSRKKSLFEKNSSRRKTFQTLKTV
jgi:multidrug resistance efflux pump